MLLGWRLIDRRSCPTAGFTILELMVATAIFAVVLLVIAVGVMRATDAYYGGVTSSSTQTTASAIIAEFSQAVEFGSAVPVVVAPGASHVGAVCIDNTMFMYKLGQEVVDKPPFAADQGYHGLIEEPVTSCTPTWPAGSVLPTGARELLGRNMRVAVFNVASVGSLTTIRLRVIAGDDTLLTLPTTPITNLPNEKCRNGAGSQFCAISDLTTSVDQRLL